MAPLSAILVVLLVSFGVQNSLPQEKVLRVYGSAGPFAPMKECAGIFSQYKGVDVRVVGGAESEWIAQAKQDADMIYSGAEYILTQSIRAHPGLIERWTRTNLYVRAAGILVRKGNPKGIKSLSDLAKPGMRILVVNGANQVGLWEDIAGTSDLAMKIHRNVVLSTATSEEAVQKWKSIPGLDAWLTYESWYHHVKDVSELVELRATERMSRCTSIAITKKCSNRETAREFIAFLKTDAAHSVFKKWGWK